MTIKDEEYYSSWGERELVAEIIKLQNELTDYSDDEQEDISCQKCGKIISKETALKFGYDICETCHKERNPKETYTCPYCKKEQTTIIEWQTMSVAQRYDITEKRFEINIDHEGGEHESYNCPTCNEELDYNIYNNSVESA